MSLLEKLSKESFEQFGSRNHNKVVFWDFLSSERKIEWMKESLELCQYFISKLKAEIRPVGRGASVNSYGMGVGDGIQSERQRLWAFFDKMEKSLLEDLDNFIEISQIKSRNKR